MCRERVSPIVLLTSILLLLTSCGGEEIPLKEGFSVEVTSIQTGYEEGRWASGTDVLCPWIKFTVVNNGTLEIQSMYVSAVIANSYGEIFYQGESVHGKLASRESADFEYISRGDAFATDVFYGFSSSGSRPAYAIGIGINGEPMEVLEVGDLDLDVADF